MKFWNDELAGEMFDIFLRFGFRNPQSTLRSRREG